MTIFVLGDTHFGHALFAQHQLRPFDTVEAMDEALIANWNATVGHLDTVYLVGDFAFGSAKFAERIFGSLNGKKHLVRGNHDSNRICRLGWESVELITAIGIGEKHRRLILCHYPIESWNGRQHGFLHAHGHIHASPFPELPNRFNVSVEMTGYKPLAVEELIERGQDL